MRLRAPKLSIPPKRMAEEKRPETHKWHSMTKMCTVHKGILWIICPPEQKQIMKSKFYMFHKPTAIPICTSCLIERHKPMMESWPILWMNCTKARSYWSAVAITVFHLIKSIKLPKTSIRQIFVWVRMFNKGQWTSIAQMSLASGGTPFHSPAI